MVEKAVISAGGKGTRLKVDHNSPKSLLPVKGKPLVGYQLEIFKEFNFKKVHLSFNSRDSIETLKEYENLPELNYSFSVHEYGHPLNLYKSGKLRKFINEEEFIWSEGDLYFKGSLIEKLLKKRKSEDSSVASKFRPTEEQYISYEINSGGKVIDWEDEVKGPDFDIIPPILFHEKDIAKIFRKVQKEEPHTGNVLKSIIDNSSLYVIDAKSLMNINRVRHLERMLKEI